MNRTLIFPLLVLQRGSTEEGTEVCHLMWTNEEVGAQNPPESTEDPGAVTIKGLERYLDSHVLKDAPSVIVIADLGSLGASFAYRNMNSWVRKLQACRSWSKIDKCVMVATPACVQLIMSLFSYDRERLIFAVDTDHACRVAGIDPGTFI